ncbi:MAG: glycerophosphodiester phosphodiesterase family protein [Christensenellaceae bacterium]
MNTVKIDKKNCRMIAHRGVSGLEKENTCAAFVAAGVKTYYGIETDVHVTADGEYLFSTTTT